MNALIVILGWKRDLLLFIFMVRIWVNSKLIYVIYVIEDFLQKAPITKL